MNATLGLPAEENYLKAYALRTGRAASSTARLFGDSYRMVAAAGLGVVHGT